MSQIVVNDEPGQAYAGKAHVSGQFPTSNLSRIASELMYFGKLAVPLSGTELEVGGALDGPQSVKLPTSAGEVLLATQGGGVVVADPSVERLRDPLNLGVPNSAPFGAFPIETSLPVMRKGQIWVQTEVALTDLTNGIFVRVANVGTIPIAALGSFTPVDTVDHEPVPAGFAWVGSAAVSGLFFGLLSVNLPG